MAEAKIFPAFMNMLDTLGIEPTGEMWQRQMKEREMYASLEKVRDYPVDKLALIEEWAKERNVRNPYTIITEMSARLRQNKVNMGGPKQVDGPRIDDQYIDEYLNTVRDRIDGCDCASCKAYEASLP